MQISATHTTSLTNFNHGHRSFPAAYARSGPPARHGPHCRTRSCTAPVRIHTAPRQHTPPPARSARAPQPSLPLPQLACLRRAVAPPSAQLSWGRLLQHEPQLHPSHSSTACSRRSCSGTIRPAAASSHAPEPPCARPCAPPLQLPRAPGARAPAPARTRRRSTTASSRGRASHASSRARDAPEPPANAAGLRAKPPRAGLQPPARRLAPQPRARQCRASARLALAPPGARAACYPRGRSAPHASRRLPGGEEEGRQGKYPRIEAPPARDRDARRG
jgi:hypothetical protein